jgi:hypothetical protein
MGFLDKAKAAAEQAASRAKEGVDDVQAKRELSQAYGELGKVAHRLIESGAIAHAKLDEAAARVRAAHAKTASGDDDGTPVAATEPADTTDPPASTT